MSEKKTELSLPVSIIISGVIISLAIVFTNSNRQVVEQVKNQGDPNAIVTEEGNLENIREVDKDDHIRGSVDAKIKIVEYSDLECSFCERVHATIKTVMDEYGEDVAWVYRQFPLTNIEAGFHVNAIRASNASECVAELGGNDAFWSFIDGLFESSSPFSDELYVSIASGLGVSGTELLECVNDGKYQDKIDKDVQNALEIGGKGTPWIVIIGPDGQKLPISGAQPISVFRSLIDQLLEEK